MGITTKTRKILWAHSGNRCAICLCALIRYSTSTDNNSVVGEECHIVARKTTGPRGNSPLPIKKRDKPDNLILLCRNHHKIIDDHPNVYTVKVLKNLKATHEARIQDKLTPKKKSDSEIFFTFRIDTGSQLWNSVVSCEAFSFENEQPKSKDEAILIGTFEQDIKDYSNLWNIIEGQHRLLAQLEFDNKIRELKTFGFLVYAVERRGKFASKSMAESWHLSVGYIILLKKSNLLVQRKDNEIEQLMQTKGQLKSDFTNFISVMLDASSHRLAV